MKKEFDKETVAAFRHLMAEEPHGLDKIVTTIYYNQDKWTILTMLYNGEFIENRFDTFEAFAEALNLESLDFDFESLDKLTTLYEGR